MTPERIARLTAEIDAFGHATISAAEVAEIAAMTLAARDVLAERRRQVEAEGWTAPNDDLYVDGEMAVAAACYTLDQTFGLQKIISPIATLWPWAMSWWKPRTRRENLVRAGALILAEIERLDRLPSPPAGGRDER